MKVLKFGGSSVATADAVRRVVAIVAAARAAGEVAVVVSALGGATDLLLAASRTAADGDRGWTDAVRELRRRHLEMAHELLADDELAGAIAAVDAGLAELGDLLHGVTLLKECSPRSADRIAATGELLSSLVVARDDEARALNAIHRRFFFPGTRRVELVLAGVGTVGRALLAQLPATAARARERGLELALVGLATSRTMVLEAAGLDPGRWRETLAAGRPTDLDDLVAFARTGGDQRMLVDCTAADAVPEHYLELLEGGVSVVGANKRPFAGPLARWRALGAAAAASGVSLLLEATVGAGLPVLSTLTDLVRTGDRVHRIDGVLSGTFNFVLDRVMAGTALSAAVREAHAAGLTEPHPADDLGGLDVARKLLILARTAGFPLEPEDVEVRGVLPDRSWSALELDTFWRRLPELDGELAARATAARAAGGTLAFLATVTPGGARVEVATLPLDHPAAGLRASENLVAFTTDRYRTTPLVVRGPGAGPEVTAAGVLADVLRTATTARRS